MAKLTVPGLKILMADDSPEDQFFVKRALADSCVGEFFYGVADGQEAIDYLRAEGQFGNRHEFPFPNLLLVDLKMPRVDGFGVLQWLREHPSCQVIPTMVFSSSGIEKDIHQAYVLGANAYIVKPSRAQDLVDLIQTTYKFWSRCEIPAPPKGERCH